MWPHPTIVGSRCIKVVTSCEYHGAGYVTVEIDQGTGFKAATTTGGYYGKGATVLDTCFADLKAVRMQNTRSDGWVGSVTFAREKAGPYHAGLCTTCTGDGSTARMILDADGDQGFPVGCLNGKICDITFDLTSDG